MPYLTCTTITIVDLAHYRVSRAKDCVSVDCGTNTVCIFMAFTTLLRIFPYQNKKERKKKKRKKEKRKKENKTNI